MLPKCLLMGLAGCAPNIIVALVLQLPGWGVEGGDWAEIDRLNEEELAAAEAALTQVMRHYVRPGVIPRMLGVHWVLTNSQLVVLQGGDGDGSVSRIAAQVQQLSLADAKAAAANGGHELATESEGDSESDVSDDDGEWETAAKSSNCQRRNRRKVSCVCACPGCMCCLAC